MNEHDQAFRNKAADRAIDDADQFFGMGAAPPQAPAPAQGAADQFFGAGAATTGQAPPPGTAAPPPAPPATGVATGDPSLVAKPQEAASRSFGDVLKAVGKDIGYGAVEAIPQFVIGGRADAIKHTFGLFSDLGQTLERTMPWLFQGGEQQRADYAALQKKYGQETLIDQPTTVTGGLARKLGEFYTGFAPAFKALRGIGMAAGGAGVLGGSIAGFITQAPDEQGLANLLSDNLPEPLSSALKPLATDPNDPALVNRARHALEQAGAGAVAEGLIRGFKAFHAWRVASNLAKAETPTAIEQAAEEVRAAGALAKAAAPAMEAEGPLFTMGERQAATVEGSATRVPLKKAGQVQPPGTQAEPVQLSNLPPPSAVSTQRTIEPSSTRATPKTAVTGEAPPSGAAGAAPGVSAGFGAEGSAKLGAPIAGSTRTVLQGSSDARAILAQANENVPQLKGGLAEIVDGVEGARTDGFGTKTWEGVQGKLDEGRPAEAISDYLRGRIIVDNPQAASDVLARLQQKWPLVGGLDDKIANPAWGYRAIHAQVEVAPGLTAEVQIVPREVAAVQNDLHALYDQIKRIPTSTATPEQQALIKQVSSQVEDGFNRAWSKQEWPVPQAMERPEVAAAQKLADVSKAMEPGVPGTVLAQAIKRGETIPDLKLNYQNLTKDNIPDVAQQIGNSIIDRIAVAKRGVMANEVTRSIANKLGMTPEDLLAKQTGEAWSAERIYGSAALIGQADRDLKALAEIARTPGSSVADGYALRRQLVYYAAMMENFMGVAGEAGRALQIFKDIHASGVLRQAKAIQAVIDRAGGMDNTRALADVIARADDFSLANTAAQGWRATTAEAIRTAEVMNLMFRPATQVRNIVGNVGMLAMASNDIKNAARVGWLLGTTPDQAITQAGHAAYVEGQFYGLRNALSMAGKALRTGESQFEKVIPGGGYTAAASETGANVAGLSASQRFAVERGLSNEQIKQFTESGFGKAIDYIATAATLPGRFLTAGDDFFKFAVYSGKARQMAVEEAMRSGLAGKDFENFVTANTLKVPDHIHLDAADWSMWATFNNKAGPITQGLMSVREALTPASYMVLPFLRTPGNIMNVFIQHSPLAAVTRTFWSDVMAGGVDRDLALGKMATGAVLLANAIALAESGHLVPTDPIDPAVAKHLGKHITGSLPDNKGLADAYIGLGVQRYALRFGEHWVAVSGMGPFAPMMSYAAELADQWRRHDIRPDEYPRWLQNVGLAVSAIYGSMRDQSYLQGFAQLMGAMDEAAKGREGAFERWAATTMGQATTNVVPFLGGMMTSTQKLWEPQTPTKQVLDWWSAVKSHTIGLSESVPPARDRLGDIMPPPTWSGDKFGRGYDWFMPFPITKFTPNPLREELVRLQSGLERLNKTESFDGVRVDFRNHPDVFDMFVRLAGNELKDPAYGLGFKDYMSAVIAGTDPRLNGQHKLYESLTDSYGESEPGTKMAYIKAEAARYKDMAAQQIMAEAPQRWPGFYKEVAAEKQRVQAFETMRAGVVPPLEDWTYKFMQQDPLPRQYTRSPPASPPTAEPPPKQQQNGGGGFTVPSTNR